MEFIELIEAEKDNTILTFRTKAEIPTKRGCIFLPVRGQKKESYQ